MKTPCKKKPSIVLATFTLQGGGAERFVLTLAKAFYDLGFSPHVLCFKNQVKYQVDTCIKLHFLDYQKIRWLPKKIRNPLFAKYFDHYIQKNIGTPSLIISNLLPVDSVLRFSQISPLAFVIHSVTSLEFGFSDSNQTHTLTKTKKQLAKIYKKHPCVCVSKGVQTDFIQLFGCQQKTTTIYNPIDKHAIITQAINKPKGLPEKYIIHVGSFKKAKGHQILIEAYARCNQTLPLVLLGEGALLPEIKSLVASLKLTHKIHFMGFKSNPYPYIKHATGMVLSSFYEGFGLVIAESQALGVPVISTDCPSGPSELLPPQNLVNVGNSLELATKINTLMESPAQFLVNFNTDFLPENVAKAYLLFAEVNLPSST